MQFKLSFPPERGQNAIERLAVHNPEDNCLIGELAVPTPDAIETAIERAHRAWRGGAPPAHVRSSWLASAARRVAEHREELARLIALEGVKTIREARLEAARCAETLRLGAEEALRLEGRVLPFDQVPAGVGRIGLYERRSCGVVVGITPFNDPLNLVAHKLAPALAAGCPVLVKPHPQTPFSALELARWLYEAGVPEAWCQVIPGRAAPARQLAADPRVQFVSFTGGREAGGEVARAAAGKALALELGGVGMVAVAADADIVHAAEAIHAGAFFAAGQNCVHAQRIIAEGSTYDALLEMLVSRASSVVLGPKCDEATDMGPCIDLASSIRLAEACRASKLHGATIAIGGNHDGTRFEATWVVNVQPNDPILNCELFGPVSTLERADDYDTILNRTAVASDSINAAIFTNSLDKAIAYWRAAPAAATIVNDSTDYRIDAMPFGGVGLAGLGREGVRDAIEAMTEKRLLVLRAR